MAGILLKRSFIVGGIAMAFLVGGVAAGWVFYDRIPLNVRQFISLETWLSIKDIPIGIPDIPPDKNRRQAPPLQAERPADERRTVTPPQRPPASSRDPVGFDTVRLNNQTLAVGGHAPAQSMVTLLVNTTPLATVTSNRQGDFSYIGPINLNKEGPSGDHVLRMRIKPPDGNEFTARAFVVLAGRSSPSEGNAGKKSTAPPKRSLIVAVDDMRTRVMQSDRRKNSTSFSIDVIDFDSKGYLYVGGVFTKSPKGVIAVYVNGKLVANQKSAIAARQKIWEAHAYTDIPAGEVYVQVDLIVGSRVKSRRRVKFTRTDDVLLSPDFSKVIVRKGDSLWRIAQFVYGSGFRYIWIFDSNSKQIADPSIIYPGQIFSLPKK